MLTRLSNRFEKDALPEAKLNVVFGVIIRLLFVALLSLSLIGRTVGGLSWTRVYVEGLGTRGVVGDCTVKRCTRGTEMQVQTAI